MPTHAWRCSRCKAVLGHVTRHSDLIVTEPAALVEKTRTAVVVHCRVNGCDAVTAFNGRRVIFDGSRLVRLSAC